MIQAIDIESTLLLARNRDLLIYELGDVGGSSACSRELGRRILVFAVLLLLVARARLRSRGRCSRLPTYFASHATRMPSLIGPEPYTIFFNCLVIFNAQIAWGVGNLMTGGC
jgi:hypothetical protein